MSDSIIFYHGRDNQLHVIDPDCIPHFDQKPTLLQIATALIIAGYKGVIIDEIRLSNGRYMHCLSTFLTTPEGRMFAEMSNAFNLGDPLPSIECVLNSIHREYASSRRNS
jgi:hypothetical protein